MFVANDDRSTIDAYHEHFTVWLDETAAVCGEEEFSSPFVDGRSQLVGLHRPCLHDLVRLPGFETAFFEVGQSEHLFLAFKRVDVAPGLLDVLGLVLYVQHEDAGVIGVLFSPKHTAVVIVHPEFRLSFHHVDAVPPLLACQFQLFIEVAELNHLVQEVGLAVKVGRTFAWRRHFRGVQVKYRSRSLLEELRLLKHED